MSKTKKIKQKTTGFDILYRVVTALACVAMYPIFYFANLFTIAIKHTDISDLLNQITGESTLHVTDESISLARLPEIIDLFSSFTNDDFDFKASVLQNALYRPVIVTAIFIAIALVIGLVILGFALFSNKVKVITGLSIAGFFSTIAAYVAFGFFANPLLSGEVTLSELLNIEGVIGTAIMSFVGEVMVCTLDTAFFGVMFVMLGICAWSVSVLIVNKSEEKEKAMKEAARKNR